MTVKYMMEDTLHYLVRQSLRQYVEFIEDVCEFTVKIQNMTTVMVSWPGSDRPNAVDKNSLFSVELVEKDGEFSYSTPTPKFEEAIVALFDKVTKLYSSKIS